MSNPTCETCRWWLNLPGFIVHDNSPPVDNYGECRRLPPVGTYLGNFTLTESDLWCGEHSPKTENKQ